MRKRSQIRVRHNGRRRKLESEHSSSGLAHSHRLRSILEPELVRVLAVRILEQGQKGETGSVRPIRMIGRGGACEEFDVLKPCASDSVPEFGW